MNSFLISLKIKESSFTGIVLLRNKNFSGSFKRISDSIFHVCFKQSVELNFLEKVELKSRSKFFYPLLPLFTDSNKKKIVRIGKVLNELSESISVSDVILSSITNEKLLNTIRLTGFLSISSKELMDILLSFEIDKKVKLLGINNLSACSYKIFSDNYSSLVENLSKHYIRRIKTIKFTELAKTTLFHPDSIYFKYLLEKARGKHDFRIVKDNLVFTEVPISEKEISIVNDVEKIIKKNKLGVFSIFSIKRVSELEIETINNSLWHLLSEEKIVPLDEKREHFIFSAELTKIINRLKKYKRNQGEIIDIASFREFSVLNRKSIIIVFGYLDSQKITSRVGNNRKIELQV